MDIKVCPITSFIETGDREIFVQKPNRYAEYPELQMMEGLKIMTMKEIDDFFSQFMNGEIEFDVINGVSMHDDLEITCDECDGTIEELEIRFTNAFTAAKINERELHYDLCETCGKENPHLIHENDLVKLCVRDHDYTLYGSILDWVPIYVDDDGDMILQNLNPDSNNFNCISLLIVNTIYILSISLEELRKIYEILECKKLDEFCKILNFAGDNSENINEWKQNLARLVQKTNNLKE